MIIVAAYGFFSAPIITLPRQSSCGSIEKAKATRRENRLFAPSHMGESGIPSDPNANCILHSVTNRHPQLRS